MFGRLKKNNREVKEETNGMTTIDEVRKAYENLSDEDKKSFSQSIKDRVDESVGEQEHFEGKEDTQGAKDRVDESLGEEKALKEKDKSSNGDSTHIDREEDNKQFEQLIAPLRKEIAEIRAAVDSGRRESNPADDKASAKLNRLKNLYEN